LAASSPAYPFEAGGFSILSGTSFSTPHVSGIVALLKAIHPNWPPAAIRSAIVTTGTSITSTTRKHSSSYMDKVDCCSIWIYHKWLTVKSRFFFSAMKTDPYGEPIFSEGSTWKLADPFYFGGGLVNPNKSAEPGLVYDMGTNDYIHYLCAVGYNDSSISLVVGKVTTCPGTKPSILDVNLPSITIPNLSKSVVLTRTVKNVGSVNSMYKSLIVPSSHWHFYIRQTCQNYMCL